MTTQRHKRGRQPTTVAEGNVVPLPPKNGRKRRRGRAVAVDEAKLAERRKRNAANRKAARHAAKAAKAARAIKGRVAPAGGTARTPLLRPRRYGGTRRSWSP
jgi:hypothetical protein